MRIGRLYPFSKSAIDWGTSTVKIIQTLLQALIKAQTMPFIGDDVCKKKKKKSREYN